MPHHSRCDLLAPRRRRTTTGPVWALAALGAALALGARETRLAAAAPPPTAPSTAPSAAPSGPAAGALEGAAAALAKNLGAVPANTLVVASPLASDQPAPRGEELVVRLAAVVAGRLGGTTRAHAQPALPAIARAVSSKAGALLYLSVELSKGDLRVTADLYPVMSNGWDRVRNPAPPPRAHAFAAAPVDAEVRAFLPAITLEQASVRRARHDEVDVLAAACGDVDGDGGLEIALVSRARVALGRLVGDRFVAQRTAAWSQLAARAPVPLREPLGGAAFLPVADGGGLHVGTTDRGGVALDALLGVRGALRGIPVGGDAGDACVQPSPEASAFVADVTSCSPVVRAPAVRVQAPAPRYDAIAVANVIGSDGSARRVVAAREPGGRLRLRVDDGRARAERTLDDAGAQVAVADLDQDGAPEIAVSANVTNPDDDDVQIFTWDGGASEPRVRRKLAAPGGVRALAACPPEARGAPGLVAVVGAEVWLVR